MAFPPAHFYHIVEPSNFASIERHGLLSTDRLVALAVTNAAERKAILGRYRPEALVLPNGTSIRDQTPMPPNLLGPALRNEMAPPDWYRLLNGFVFLWANRERVERHLKAFQGRSQIVLLLDARLLLAEEGHRLLVSPINSGNARRAAVARSRDLFVPYREWAEKGWRSIDGRTRARTHFPVEVVVEGHLPLRPYLVETEWTE